MYCSFYFYILITLHKAPHTGHKTILFILYIAWLSIHLQYMSHSINIKSSDALSFSHTRSKHNNSTCLRTLKNSTALEKDQLHAMARIIKKENRALFYEPPPSSSIIITELTTTRQLFSTGLMITNKSPVAIKPAQLPSFRFKSAPSTHPFSPAFLLKRSPRGFHTPL